MGLTNGLLQHRRRDSEGALMHYRLNRGLFLDNGPTLLAERDRQVRAAGQAYRLLTAVRPASPAAPKASPLSRAA